MKIGLKSGLLAGLLGLVVTGEAEATMVVIGDVDALNVETRPENLPLIENVRDGGTDILWLTGGFDFSGDYYTSRYQPLTTEWTGAGATIEVDETTGIAASLTGRDLVVFTQFAGEGVRLDAGAVSRLATFLAGGGDLLFVAQGTGSDGYSYNDLLSDLGSEIAFGVAGGGFETPDIDTSTPYGAGVSDFELNGWYTLSGGTAVVTKAAGVGVTFEDLTSTPVPLPAAAPLLAGALAVAGLVARRRG